MIDITNVVAMAEPGMWFLKSKINLEVIYLNLS